MCLPALLGLLLAAGCGKTGETGSDEPGVEISVGGLSHTPAAAGRTALVFVAHAVAQSPLGALRVPIEAIPVAGAPRSSRIRFAPAQSATPNLIDAHRIWRMPESPREVMAAVRRGHHSGLTMNGGGSAGRHGVGEREVECTIGVSTSVRRIIAALETLPIVQPGTVVCPEEPVGPIVRLTFRDSTGGVLAEAVQAAGEEVGDCSPMYFSVRGHMEKPLANGASVIGVVSQILDLRLLPG